MRDFKITKTKETFLNNLTQAIELKLGQDKYLVTEQDIVDKYKVDIEKVIQLEKEAILFEEESSPKLRRNKILKNLYENGLDFYKENNNGSNSDFTDALIINKGKLLLGLRSKDCAIAPNKWGLLGSGHLEKFLSLERNIKKEVKEETGLDVLDCKLVNVRKINDGKNKIYYFMVTIPDNSEVVLNQEEHSNYKWVSVEDIEQMDAEDFMFDLKDYLLHSLLGK